MGLSGKNMGFYGILNISSSLGLKRFPEADRKDSSKVLDDPNSS